MEGKSTGNLRSRRWVLGAGIAAAAGPAIAQGARSHEDIAQMARAAASNGAGPLKILLPHGSNANVAPIVAEFQRLTGIETTMTEVPVDEVDIQLSLDHISGVDRFDIALPPTFSLPDLVEGGVITPLSALDGFAELSGLHTNALFTIGDTFDGATYGFQTDGDAYVMFYNNDFLADDTKTHGYEDRYGVALKTPQTWEELDRQMTWFHRPDEGAYGGILFRNPGYVAWEWWVRFHAMGMWPLSPDMTPQLATDAGVCALEAMIRATACLAPEAATAGLFENWERYARGDIYANVGWGGSQKYFNKPGSGLRGKLSYGATPGGLIDGNLLVTPYFNWGWDYVVLSNSPNQQLAMLFAAFATSPEISTLSVKQADGFFDPFRPEHYDDAGIREAYSEPFLQVHRDSMENAIPDLYLARHGDYFRSLSKWIGRAMDGTTSPEMALRRIEQQWNIVTAEVGRAPQTERWMALRAKYPANAQNLLSDVAT